MDDFPCQSTVRTFKMNIHEYQAKQLFAEAGVAVPNGTVAQSAEDFDQAGSPPCLPTSPSWSKPRFMPVGGAREPSRMVFREACRVVSSAEDAKAKAEAMLGSVLVTKQTGEAGKG